MRPASDETGQYIYFLKDGRSVAVSADGSITLTGSPSKADAFKMEVAYSLEKLSEPEPTKIEYRVAGITFTNVLYAALWARARNAKLRVFEIRDRRQTEITIYRAGEIHMTEIQIENAIEKMNTMGKREYATINDWKTRSNHWYDRQDGIIVFSWYHNTPKTAAILLGQLIDACDLFSLPLITAEITDSTVYQKGHVVSLKLLTK